MTVQKRKKEKGKRKGKKKKGPLALPKSREETPKEGSDSARRYRTATICDRAAQKARAFELFPVQNSTHPGDPPKVRCMRIFRVISNS